MLKETWLINVDILDKILKQKKDIGSKLKKKKKSKYFISNNILVLAL